MNSVTQLQLEFGGYSQRVTNIIYTNGFIDSWLYDGIVSASGENVTVINIDCKEILHFIVTFSIDFVFIF